MFIVAIGWIYVVLMMSITEKSVIAGIMTFFMYGVFPLAVILYLLGTSERRRRRNAAEKLLQNTIQPEVKPHQQDKVQLSDAP
jgi:biotin transporter BioY